MATMASGERFGYEWDHFPEIIPEYEGQFLLWAHPLTQQDFAGKSILDVGCGTGRNMYWPLKYGASHAVGIDVDDRTLAAARKNLATFSRAEVRACSAYDLAEENQYDIVFSIGVIHHLERPRDAIQNMIRATKPGGKVFMWVYGREGNEFIVTMVNALRRALVPLPPFVSDAVSFVFTVPLWLWLKIFPHKKPYWKQLAGFRFWHIRSIVLDQMLPKVANYWTREEALALFNGLGLTDVQVYPCREMSWTVIGTKAA